MSQPPTLSCYCTDLSQLSQAQSMIQWGWLHSRSMAWDAPPTFFQNMYFIKDKPSHLLCLLKQFCIFIIGWTSIEPCIVTCFYSKTNQMHRSQIYFIWSNGVRVSDGLSVHHQEFSTVRTATGICQTYCRQLASGNEMFHLVPAGKKTAVSDICPLLYMRSWTPDGGRKDLLKHVECCSK